VEVCWENNSEDAKWMGSGNPIIWNVVATMKYREKYLFFGPTHDKNVWGSKDVAPIWCQFREQGCSAPSVRSLVSLCVNRSNCSGTD